MNKRGEVELAFERALEGIQARVSVLAAGKITSFAVAYSGGLDSSVLLHLACRYAHSHSMKVYAFHVHHGLSPNADDWLQHCRIEAEKLGAQFDAAKLHISAESVSAHGTEQAARIGRYKALGEMCGKSGLRLLLAAHHQDDQAETLMLQLLRGAGLPGLSGMAAMQEDHALLNGDIVLGRPLLEVSRAALEEYASRHRLPYVVDESNQDASYRRNALRQCVFPVLREHFAGFSACIARSASHIRTAQTLLQELAALDLEKCRSEFDEMALNLDALNSLSSQRLNNVLRHWLDALGLQMPSTARLEELRLQLLKAQHDKQPRIEFGEFALSRVGRYLVLHPNLGSAPAEEMSLQWQGEAEIPIPRWHGTLVFERVEANGIAERELLALPLAIRARRGQEKLKIAANRPSKTLKNLFQEALIPVWQREWLPLVYLNQKLVFVAGLGMNVSHSSDDGPIALSWRPAWQNTR